ncbi:MAG: MFS transporter [Burkholderiales bacterium]|nr:MFS transporter [Burkholderiales bacterium]
MTAAQATPPTTRWRAAIVALLLGVIAALYIGKLPPAIPALRGELSLSLAQSGAMVSAFNTLGMLASIFMGLIAARLGAWQLCMTGLASLAAGGVIGALAAGAPMLLASRFLEGAGFLSIVVAAPGLIMLSTAVRDRRRVFSFWGAYMPAGTTLGMLLAPLVLESWGWRALWLAGSACALAALATLAALRADFPQPHQDGPRSWRASAAPLKAAGPWWIALAFGCYAFNYYAIMVWLPTFMVGERGTPLGLASLLTAIMVAANIPGNLLGGVLLQRGFARGTNVCLAAVATALTCAIAFAPALPDGVRYLGCVAFSFAVGVLPGSVMSAAQTHARSPAQVGTVQGMINQGSNLGQFASPLLVTAVVGAALAWDRMLYLLLASSVVIFVSGLAIRIVEARIVDAPGR